MGKNFDVERQARVDKDRTFTINGHTFTYRPAVAPDELSEWAAMVGGEYVERDASGTIMLGEDRKPISSLSENQALEIYERTIRAFLEPGQEAAWAEARSPRQANPINLADLTDVLAYLFEETSGRPTGQSSGSSASGPGGGNGQPAIGSTPVSPLPVAAPQG